MKGKQQDSRFEQYRRERKMRQAEQVVESTEPNAHHTTVTKALEAQEARESRDQQITREVHDFFAASTRTAAEIVQKFSAKVETESTGKVSREMEDFLRDAIRRAESFMALLRLQGQGPEAEKILRTQMQNLVGPLLDSFREEGTAAVQDKHLGKDPFKVDPPNAGGQSVIDEHLVAQVHGTIEMPEPLESRGAVQGGTSRASWKDGWDGKSGKDGKDGRDGRESKDGKDPKDGKDTKDGRTENRSKNGSSAAQPGTRAIDHPLLAGLSGDLDKLRKALRLLVENGLMPRADAEQIWQQHRAQSPVQ